MGLFFMVDNLFVVGYDADLGAAATDVKTEIILHIILPPAYTKPKLAVVFYYNKPVVTMQALCKISLTE